MSRVLDTFLELVAIDSPSGEEAACARDVARRLAAAGLAVGFDDTAGVTGSDTGNLVATLSATALGKRVVLSAHLDTVEPGRGIEPVIEGGVIRASGDTILAADDKSGIAAIIEALQRLAEEGRPHGEIVVVLTTGEELGLRGAKALDPTFMAGADLAVVLDAGGTPGGIVEGAPTHYTFTADFRGKSAHAGMAPENGRSALAMAADAVRRMRLGRLDEMTTANIGTIDGGTATNVVAASCTVTGECRSLVREQVEAVRAEMDAALREGAATHGGQVDVRWTKEYDGYLFAPDDPVLLFAEQACREAGLEPYTFRTGGGSDGNVFSGQGVPTLVLASGMTDVHCVSETLRVEDLEKLADLVDAILRLAVA